MFFTKRLKFKILFFKYLLIYMNKKKNLSYIRNISLTFTAKRVRRGRPRLGTRGGRHMASIHGNSPSRGDWLPLDMRTTPPSMPAFRGFEETSSDGVVSILKKLFLFQNILTVFCSEER